MDTQQSKTSSQSWIPLAIVTIAFSVLLGICVIASALGLLATQGNKTLPIEAHDREAILGIDTIAEWTEDFEPVPQLETFTKSKLFDNSIELEYVYDDSIYLYCSINIELKTNDAVMGYQAVWSSTKLAIKAFGENIEIEEENDLFQWGNNSKYAVIFRNGEPLGHMFIARQKKRIFFVAFTGVYFEDTSVLTQILTPPLERLESYQP